MKKYVMFEVIVIILLVLFTLSCNKTDRDNAKAMYNSQASNSNRQALTSDLYYLASLAQDFYKKPIINNGGGNSWSSNVDNVGKILAKDYNISENTLSTKNGKFILSISGDVLKIVGTGNKLGNDKTTNVKATISITGAKSNYVVKVNN